MLRTRSATVARGLALAVSFLLLGVASGDLGHAFASPAAWGAGNAVLVADSAPGAPVKPTPHSEKDCLLCRAARASSAVLTAGAVGGLAVPETSRAISIPEMPAPAALLRRTETARAPPTRLFA
jgi:hypothetical protein